MISLGTHIVVEYFNCEPENLNDVVHIENAMTEAARKAGSTIINSTFHHFSPFGVSGVVVIQESHLAIHTWPEYGFASVDIFTCGGAVNPWVAYSSLKKSLKAEFGSAMQMNRGPSELLPKQNFELHKIRSEQTEVIDHDLKTTRDIWFTERNEYLALSLKHTGKKLYDRKSRFQRVEVYKTFAFGKMLTLDGMVMCTEEDESVYHEMISHVPMITHPHPEEILVVGGGDGGTVRELLKHPTVRKISLVEIDEKVIEASRKFFPTLASSFKSDKVEVSIEDGIEFVKNSKPDTYDLVIIDSNDPVGPAEGLFTDTFYRDVYRVLRKSGIMITQSESPRFNQKVFREIYTCYRNIFGMDHIYCYLAFIPTYPTGMWSFSYCVKDASLHPLKNIDERRVRRLMKMGNLKYYNEDIHRSAFALPNFVKDLLK